MAPDDDEENAEVDSDRLAQLIHDDEDDDEETEDDRLRTLQLMEQSNEVLELDEEETAASVSPQPVSRAPVVTVVATTRRAEEEEEEDELDHHSTTEGIVDARLRATRHDAKVGYSGEIVMECVWENQILETPVLEKILSRKNRRGVWRLCRGGSQDGRVAFESPTRPELAEVFARGMREVAPLPDLSWRWISPWQVDSVVHGSDRVSIDEDERAASSGWLYSSWWPTDDVGYTRRDDDARVRCRRWIRPRERVGASVFLQSLLEQGVDETIVAQAFRKHQEDSGVIDLDRVASELPRPSLPLPPPPPPPPPRTTTTAQNIGASIVSAAATAAARSGARINAAVSEAPPRPPPEPLAAKEGDGVVLDFVWENQRWRPAATKGGAWTNKTLIRRPPFEASRPGLDVLFKKFNGPPSLEEEFIPENTGLPTSTTFDEEGEEEWRWLGPWVVDSESFGQDRTLASPSPLKEGWLYAFDWPPNDCGYKATQDPSSFVRCRRWVRPRERQRSSTCRNSPASPAYYKDLKLFT